MGGCAVCGFRPTPLHKAVRWPAYKPALVAACMMLAAAESRGPFPPTHTEHGRKAGTTRRRNQVNQKRIKNWRGRCYSGAVLFDDGLTAFPWCAAGGRAVRDSSISHMTDLLLIHGMIYERQQMH